MTDIVGGLLDYQTKALQNQTRELQNRGLMEELLAGEEAKVKAQKIADLFSQQEQQPAPEQREMSVPDSANLTAMQVQTANRLFQAGQTALSIDPKAGKELLDEAGKIHESALKARKLELDNQKAILEHIGGWTNQVKDEPSFNFAKEQVEARAPGAWKQAGLPDTYSPAVLPKMRYLGRASQTALQQVDTQIKEIDLKTRAQRNQLDIEQRQATLQKTRVSIAAKRDGLPKPKEDKTTVTINKAIVAERNRFAKEEETIRANVIKDKSIKAEAVRKDSGIFGSEVFGDKYSPREEEIARRTEAARARHEQNLRDLGGDVSTASKGPTQIKSEADYNALPSGTVYIDPTGKQRTKK